MAASLALVLVACSSSAPEASGGRTVPVVPRQDSAGRLTFTKDIAPIMKQKCVACHGRLVPQKGLRLHSRDGALAGGDSGPAVVAGNPASSLLYTALVLPPDDPRRMPPVAGGNDLSKQEIDIVRRWIAEGAK